MSGVLHYGDRVAASRVDYSSPQQRHGRLAPNGKRDVSTHNHLWFIYIPSALTQWIVRDGKRLEKQLMYVVLFLSGWNRDLYDWSRMIID
jgi:hypothetical protein